jgi:SAM-dependent methyltransferase
MATFDERAKEWDTPDRIERAAAVADAIRAAVPLSRDLRAIEIGAGTGLLGLHFAGDIASLLLTDPSTGMLEVAAEKIRRGGLTTVAAARYDLLADPAPAGPFDLVLSLLVLHHVGDTAAAFRAIFGLLAPGGRIALADLDKEDGTFHDADAEGIHHLGFERDDVAAFARAAGFLDVTFSTADVIEKNLRTYPLFLLTARRPDLAAESAGTAYPSDRHDGPPGASMSSTSTPWHDRGWRNATGPSAPRRGALSMSSRPLIARRVSSSARFATSRHTWWKPSPCFARKRATPVVSSVGSTSSIFDSPIPRNAIRTRSDGISMTCSSGRPRRSRYSPSDASIERTMTAT